MPESTGNLTKTKTNMKTILDEITEAQVLAWLNAKYTALREAGEPVDHLEVLCQDYGEPEVLITAYCFPKTGDCRSGHRKQSIADAVTALHADIEARKPDPVELRKQAQAMLDQAAERDGKPAFIAFRPDAGDVDAEATTEGRTIPKPRPNPHEA